MPQIGQFPGALSITFGCMTQVYRCSAPAAATEQKKSANRMKRLFMVAAIESPTGMPVGLRFLLAGDYFAQQPIPMPQHGPPQQLSANCEVALAVATRAMAARTINRYFIQ